MRPRLKALLPLYNLEMACVHGAWVVEPLIAVFECTSRNTQRVFRSAGADHDGVDALVPRILAQLRRPVALIKAKDLLYRRMCGGCYSHRQKVFKTGGLYKGIFGDIHHQTLQLW